MLDLGAIEVISGFDATTEGDARGSGAEGLGRTIGFDSELRRQRLQW